MRSITIRGGKAILVDDEDYHWVKDLVIGYNGRYACVSARGNQKSLYIHNLILQADGVDVGDGNITDHINRNSLDNRKINLRRISQQQNTWNRHPKRSKSGYIGVKAANRKWQASINQNGQLHRVYYGPSKLAAARAYDREARRLRGKFVYTNF